jgi:hypothetical protein
LIRGVTRSRHSMQPYGSVLTAKLTNDSADNRRENFLISLLADAIPMFER